MVCIIHVSTTMMTQMKLPHTTCFPSTYAPVFNSLLISRNLFSHLSTSSFNVISKASISLSSSSFSSALLEERVVSCQPRDARGVVGNFWWGASSCEGAWKAVSEYVDCARDGALGTGWEGSPRRKWRLWYFNNEGRCLGSTSRQFAIIKTISAGAISFSVLTR